MLSRKVLHLELSRRLPPLADDPRFAGLFLVFWCDGIPVAHREVLSRDLPMSAEDLTALALDALSASHGEEIPGAAGPGVDSQSAISQWRARLRTLHELIDDPPRTGSTSVIVCTRDRPDQLLQCLHSLRDLAYPPAEIVVVDNAPSTEATRHVVSRMPGVRYVVEPRRGLDRARNAGVRSSAGDFVAFVDDDVVVHPHWLGRLLRGFRDPRVMAVTGLVLPAELDTEAQLIFETHWSFNRGYRARTFDAAFFDQTRRLGVPVWEIGAGASMAFRRRVFELVGEFDERLDVGAAGCSGDSELWYRVLAEGWHCRYEPAAVAYHRHRRSSNDLDRQMYYYMRGHVAALLIQFEKYRHWGNLRRVFATLPRAYLILLAQRLLSGPDLRNRTIRPEVRGCLSGLLFYLRNRPSRTAFPQRTGVPEHEYRI